MQHRGFSLRDHLHRAFIADLLRRGSKGDYSKGCGGISSVIGILLFLFILVILSHAVHSGLPSDLHKQLITRVDHSFKGGLLFLQPLSVLPQLVA
jgi:hypothetical protein